MAKDSKTSPKKSHVPGRGKPPKGAATKSGRLLMRVHRI